MRETDNCVSKGIFPAELFGSVETDSGVDSSLALFVWSGVNTARELGCWSKQLGGLGSAYKRTLVLFLCGMNVI